MSDFNVNGMIGINGVEAAVRGAIFHEKIYSGISAAAVQKWVDVSNLSVMGFQAKGIGSGTVDFQATLEGVAVPKEHDIEVKDKSGTFVTSITADGIYYVEAAPLWLWRADVTDATGMTAFEIWLFGRTF